MQTLNNQTISKAIEYINVGNMSQAADILQNFLIANPRHADALHLLGVTALQSNKPDLAIELINKAFDINQNPVYLNNLGTALRRIGKLDESIQTYEKSILLQKNNSKAHYNLANALKEQDKLKEAISAYKKAIKYEPNLADAHNNMGNAYHGLEDFKSAELCFKKAIELKPDYAEAYHNLGMTLLEDKNKIYEAIDAFNQAIFIKSDYCDPYDGLGVAYYNLNNIDDMIKNLNIAVGLSPLNGDAICKLGYAFLALGKTNEAMDCFRNTVALAHNAESTLFSAICLTIDSYLKNDLNDAALYLNVATPLLDKFTKKKHDASKSYVGYLAKLVLFRNSFSQINNLRVKTLYVIGESHMLAAHGLCVSLNGEIYKTHGYWIEGCKQWHLANSELNRFKMMFEGHLKRIPNNSVALITIGEIDCRIDEGIFKAYNKSKNKSINDLIEDTTTKFIEYVSHLACQKNLKIIISAIPYSAKNLKEHSSEEIKEFFAFLETFNTKLCNLALKENMYFLDVYSMTKLKNGIFHIDSYHLKPDAIVKAFSEFLITNNASPDIKKEMALLQSNLKTIDTKIERINNLILALKKARLAYEKAFDGFLVRS